jgi:hypothetical protein
MIHNLGDKVARVRRYLYMGPLDYAKWATHYGLHQYKVNKLYCDARFLMSWMPSNGRPMEKEDDT